VATAKFSKFAGILSAALSQHHLSGFGIAQLEETQSWNQDCREKLSITSDMRMP